jgi:pimeloyl-ACP methyl ester carboxylesterase
MSLSWIVIIALGSLVAVYLVSYIVEALRRGPMAPQTLVGASNIPVQHLDAGGVRVRYIKTGSGPNLILLHTLRTQLDLFEKVVPDLAKSFTVWALDYPGHGYSDIPKARYDADFFVRAVGSFLDALDLRDATLCGVSIGGAIALIAAGRRNPRVARVIAINPYDYFNGRGMTRSSFLGWMIVTTSENSDPWRHRDAAAQLHHHEGGSARRGRRSQEHSARANEGNV